MSNLRLAILRLCSAFTIFSFIACYLCLINYYFFLCLINSVNVLSNFGALILVVVDAFDTVFRYCFSILFFDTVFDFIDTALFTVLPSIGIKGEPLGGPPPSDFGGSDPPGLGGPFILSLALSTLTS